MEWNAEDQIVPCQFFLRGRCPHGISCLYTHYQPKPVTAKLKAAFYIGKFDPFHLGHFETVLEALNHADRIFIVVDTTRTNTATFQDRYYITKSYRFPSSVTVVEKSDAEIICKSHKNAIEWVQYKANLKTVPVSHIGDVVGSDRFRSYVKYPNYFLFGQTIIISKKKQGHKNSAPSPTTRLIHISTSQSEHSSTQTRLALRSLEHYSNSLGLQQAQFDYIKEHCLYESNGYCIIADVGGTSVKFGWRKLASDFLEWNHVRIGGMKYMDIFQNPDTAPKRLFQQALDLSGIPREQLVHFGISMSGHIDHERQSIIKSERLDELAHPKSYHLYSFQHEIDKQIFDLGQRTKSWIVNDGIASALGFNIGHCRVIVITLGTFPAVTVVRQDPTNRFTADNFEWGDLTITIDTKEEIKAPIWEALSGKIISNLNSRQASLRVGQSLVYLCERYYQVFGCGVDKVYICGGNSVNLNLGTIRLGFSDHYVGSRAKPSIMKKDGTYEEQSKRHLAGCYNYMYLSLSNLIKINTNT